MDRPTFETLRNTMKEMERNHKVRRVRTFFKGRIDLRYERSIKGIN